jgi:hypothetical protein
MNNVSVGGSQGNILIKPSAGVVVSAFLNNVRLRGGTFGLRADNTGGSGAISVQFQSGWSNTHRSGIVALGTSSAAVSIVFDRSTAEGNPFGAVAAGAQASMIVTDSTIVYNVIGLDQEAGASLADYANNAINFNSAADTNGSITTLSKK